MITVIQTKVPLERRTSSFCKRQHKQRSDCWGLWNVEMGGAVDVMVLEVVTHDAAHVF